MLYWAARRLRCPCAPYLGEEYRTSGLRAWVADMVGSVWFELGIGVVVLADLGLLALTSYKSAAWQVCLCVCVRARERVRVRACVSARVRVFVRACV